MGHHPGGIREDLAPRDVVGVVVAVDEEPDGLGEAPRDLGLEPPRGVGVDRVGRDDALGGHGEHRVVEVAAEPIDRPGERRERSRRCGALSEGKPGAERRDREPQAAGEDSAARERHGNLLLDAITVGRDARLTARPGRRRGATGPPRNAGGRGPPRTAVSASGSRRRP